MSNLSFPKGTPFIPPKLPPTSIDLNSKKATHEQRVLNQNFGRIIIETPKPSSTATFFKKIINFLKGSTPTPPDPITTKKVNIQPKSSPKIADTAKKAHIISERPPLPSRGAFTENYREKQLLSRPLPAEPKPPSTPPPKTQVSAPPIPKRTHPEHLKLKAVKSSQKTSTPTTSELLGKFKEAYKWETNEEVHLTMIATSIVPNAYKKESLITKENTLNTLLDILENTVIKDKYIKKELVSILQLMKNVSWIKKAQEADSQFVQRLVALEKSVQ